MSHDWSQKPSLGVNKVVKWYGDDQKAQRCYCGATNCTGYLGRAPTKNNADKAPPTAKGNGTPTKVKPASPKGNGTPTKVKSPSSAKAATPLKPSAAKQLQPQLKQLLHQQLQQLE